MNVVTFLKAASIVVALLAATGVLHAEEAAGVNEVIHLIIDILVLFSAPF